MEDYNLDEVKNCYDSTAKQYSDQFSNELEGKPFDRNLLESYAKSFNKKAMVVEFGAGSGHIANYLSICGIKNVIGTDISEKSIKIAQIKYPKIKFENRNMLNSEYENGSIDGIVCFYGIVHFTYKEIESTLREWKRILKHNGRALFSFHIGDDNSIRVEKFLDIENAKATWNYFDVDKVLEIMDSIELQYDEVVVRYPYFGMEHPSQRCYIQFTNK